MNDHNDPSLTPPPFSALDAVLAATEQNPAEQALQDTAIGEAIATHSAAIDEAFQQAKDQLIGQLAGLYYQRARGATIEMPHHVVIGDITIVLNPVAEAAPSVGAPFDEQLS